MKYLELILPFGIPPLAFAKDINKQLKAPALATLVTRGARQTVQHLDGFAAALPHEFLLAGQVSTAIARCPPSTHLSMQEFGLQEETGYWFTINPVHIHVARDHLILTDARQLDFQREETTELFSIAEKICQEYGKQLRYGDAGTWFLRADDWNALQTSTPDAACGHNIEIWMPRGDCARQWRQLQNEIQMHWHSLPLNESREERGLKTVNSVWLWGGSAKLEQTANIIKGLQHFNELNNTPQQRVLINNLLVPALSSDWGNWIANMHEIEKNWLAPALSALQAGQIKQLKLSLTDTRSHAEFSISPWSLKKFWRPPSLSPLFSSAYHDTN